MARINAGALMHQVSKLGDSLRVSQEYGDQLQLLRRVENLTEANFQGFLDERSLELPLIDGSIFLPLACTVQNPGQGVGKFARQA